MDLDGLRVAVTGAGRDTGRLLAEAFAERGAQIFLSARDLAAAEHVADVINQRGPGQAEAFRCDLAAPDSVRAFAAAVARRTKHLDVLINNGTPYLEGDDLGDVSDDQIRSVMAAGGTGTALLTKHLLPLLRTSSRPDIVNMISACGELGHRRSGAHPAFYAAKHAHAGLAEILSHRLRPEGIRVISLFPPDFVQDGPRQADNELTARSVVDCVLFAVSQPRDCFIREFHFEQVQRPRP
ncbi:NAD(P)-dependent dehydrogenase, short-chain alcohol dehydrogenase family [Micromonospora viridifaciens]|uniref:NAD(P)-dependent dehydrogenase, short-chain alcohol dehydrogenase family n=1 Tax=Micromonospora viridifaciens TaxID=1881 RepID=A0A1C4WD13_MICVI|nr:SDR family oxidoreductase [Micromonospora viridifaciens]SCE94103.1 NAD(P)-dependent dehydrogenase, short-chain alcohol dehydrogenase family [Micromonospora viridifaciens]